MCRYCSRLYELRRADKLAFEKVLNSWKYAYERQEKLLRRALLCVCVDEDKTLMADILKEINSPCIK